MDGSDSFHQHMDHLLARVEHLQQALAQLYMELQALRISRHVPYAEPAPAEPPPVENVAAAVPVPQGHFALGPVDRRGSPRRQANQVLLSISSALDDSPPFEGWVLDYSQVGMGLFVEHRLEKGAYLHVRPYNRNSHDFAREAQVKNCLPYLDGWRLGCQLDHELTHEDLQLFGLE